MATCPMCTSRKGKRYCPALDKLICSKCCAAHRLGLIQCPPDCEHLASEHYQLARRKQRATSSGRRLLETLATLFLYDDSREFAFLVSADLYWWMVRQRPMMNGELAAAFELAAAPNSAGGEVGSLPGDLGRYLAELAERGRRHQKPIRGADSARRKADVFRSIASHLSGLDAGSESFHADVEDYFSKLDFVADLDYSPEEELIGNDAAGSGATPGDEAARAGS